MTRARMLPHAALGLGAVALSAGLAACSPQTAAPESSSAPQPAPSGAESGQPDVTATPGADSGSGSGDPDTAYIDGQYSARGWYGGLPSHHDVTLTIDDDVVTAVEITTPAEDETSLGYQQRFAEALPGAVVGRSIDEIAVDRLAGSSGCSEGFMDALAQIKDQAAA